MPDVSALVSQMQGTLSSIHETISGLDTTEHDTKLDALEQQRDATIQALRANFHLESESLGQKRKAAREAIAERRRKEDEERAARRRREDEALAEDESFEDREREAQLEGETKEAEEETDAKMDEIEAQARKLIEDGVRRLAALEERRKELNRLIDEQLKVSLPPVPARRRARNVPAVAVESKTSPSTDENKNVDNRDVKAPHVAAENSNAPLVATGDIRLSAPGSDCDPTKTSAPQNTLESATLSGVMNSLESDQSEAADATASVESAEAYKAKAEEKTEPGLPTAEITFHHAGGPSTLSRGQSHEPAEDRDAAGNDDVGDDAATQPTSLPGSLSSGGKSPTASKANVEESADGEAFLKLPESGKSSPQPEGHLRLEAKAFPETTLEAAGSDGGHQAAQSPIQQDRMNKMETHVENSTDIGSMPPNTEAATSQSDGSQIRDSLPASEPYDQASHTADAPGPADGDSNSLGSLEVKLESNLDVTSHSPDALPSPAETYQGAHLQEYHTEADDGVDGRPTQTATLSSRDGHDQHPNLSPVSSRDAYDSSTLENSPPVSREDVASPVTLVAAESLNQHDTLHHKHETSDHIADCVSDDPEHKTADQEKSDTKILEIPCGVATPETLGARDIGESPGTSPTDVEDSGAATNVDEVIHSPAGLATPVEESGIGISVPGALDVSLVPPHHLDATQHSQACGGKIQVADESSLPIESNENESVSGLVAPERADEFDVHLRLPRIHGPEGSTVSEPDLEEVETSPSQPQGGDGIHVTHTGENTDPNHLRLASPPEDKETATSGQLPTFLDEARAEQTRSGNTSVISPTTQIVTNESENNSIYGVASPAFAATATAESRGDSDHLSSPPEGHVPNELPELAQSATLKQPHGGQSPPGEYQRSESDASAWESLGSSIATDGGQHIPHMEGQSVPGDSDAPRVSLQQNPQVPVTGDIPGQSPPHKPSNYEAVADVAMDQVIHQEYHGGFHTTGIDIARGITLSSLALELQRDRDHYSELEEDVAVHNSDSMLPLEERSDRSYEMPPAASKTGQHASAYQPVLEIPVIRDLSGDEDEQPYTERMVFPPNGSASSHPRPFREPVSIVNEALENTGSGEREHQTTSSSTNDGVRNVAENPVGSVLGESVSRVETLGPSTSLDHGSYRSGSSLLDDPQPSLSTASSIAENEGTNRQYQQRQNTDKLEACISDKERDVVTTTTSPNGTRGPRGETSSGISDKHEGTEGNVGESGGNQESVIDASPRLEHNESESGVHSRADK